MSTGVLTPTHSRTTTPAGDTGAARRRRREPTRTRLRLSVVIPAHDEVATIASTIESVLSQDRTPDQVVVVCDNCSDGTADVARRYPVRVVETVGNTHKKAGALNQALPQVMDGLRDDDAVMVMDADSVLQQGFLAEAERRLLAAEVSAVGGTFTGQEGGGFVGMCQRNEYARYARDVTRRGGKVLVLTGTATVFAVGALRDVVRARSQGRLPGAPEVYDTRVLTEDNELTLALLTLGHEIVSPRRCRLTTEVMPTWRELARQRLRWKRGALENLTDYGFTRVTREYWGRQLLSLLGVLVTFTYLGALLWAVGVEHHLTFFPIWLTVTAIFVAERVVTVRSRGPVQMLVGAVLVVEMVYDVFLQTVQARAFIDAAVRRERKW